MTLLVTTRRKPTDTATLPRFQKAEMDPLQRKMNKLETLVEKQRVQISKLETSLAEHQNKLSQVKKDTRVLKNTLKAVSKFQEKCEKILIDGE